MTFRRMWTLEALFLTGLVTDMAADFAQLAKQAIEAGKAGARSLLRNPEYLELRNEAGKFSQPAGDPPRWERIEELSQNLAPRGADLLVYTLLCQSAFISKGYAPLVEALRATALLVKGSWEFCSPRKQRDKVFEAWARRMAVAIGEKTPSTPQAKTDAQACIEAAEELAAALYEVTGAAGDVADLNRALEPFAPKPEPAPEPEPPPEPVREATPEPVQSAAAQAEAPPSQVETKAPGPARAPEPTAAQESQSGSPAETKQEAKAEAPPASSVSAPAREAEETSANVGTLLREASQAVTRLAAKMREEKLDNPASYKLLRTIVWATASPPTGDKNQKTRLPPPPAHVVKFITGPIPDAAVEQNLHAGEEQFRTYPLWMDLQYRVARCLDMLKASEASAMVGELAAELMGRFPELLELKFSNGLPFVSDEAKSWINNQKQPTRSMAPAASGARPSTPALSASPAPARAVTLRAPAPVVVDLPEDTADLPEGLGPGLALLKAQAQREPSGRGRFERRLRMAELCIAHQRSDLAAPLLRSLVSDIDDFELEVWEPELAARALRLSLIAGSFELGDEETRRTARFELWSRLCEIDPASAVDLSFE